MDHARGGSFEAGDLHGLVEKSIKRKLPRFFFFFFAEPLCFKGYRTVGQLRQLHAIEK